MSAANGTSTLFNSAIGAAAIAACFELGLFDELERAGSVELPEFCRRRGLGERPVRAMLEALRCFDIVEIDGDELRRGRGFSSACRDKGYFLWLVRGYGALMQGLPDLLRNGRWGSHLSRERDGESIAVAARDYGARFVDPHFARMIDHVPFGVAADLGCGSAERLIDLARRRPDFRGVGIDLNGHAVRLAREAVARENLSDRIEILEADVTSLEPRPELAEVETIFSFFMGHDLWPREHCLEALKRVRAVFPRAHRFLLCDTVRKELSPDDEMPIFTLGFELTHALMGRYVPSAAEWRDVFVESGWRSVAEEPVGIPFSVIFDLRREPRSCSEERNAGA